MIIVIFIALIVMVVISYKILDNGNHNDLVEGLWVFSVIGLVFCTIALILLLTSIPESNTIDDKIAMYEQENKSIETSISKVVESYKDYEKDLFTDIKPDTYIAVATQVYPELKSNELVKQQIKLYTDNNKKIKELKEEKLNYRVTKWWLYFGG